MNDMYRKPPKGWDPTHPEGCWMDDLKSAKVPDYCVPRFTTYDNTPENAKKIGWDKLPEYCDGDLTAPKVTHDTERGIFFFREKTKGDVMEEHAKAKGIPIVKQQAIISDPADYKGLPFIPTPPEVQKVVMDMITERPDWQGENDIGNHYADQPMKVENRAMKADIQHMIEIINTSSGDNADSVLYELGQVLDKYEEESDG